MSEDNTRTRRLNYRVTEAEYTLIEEKMRRRGMKNVSAYLRKMALDGCVLRLDLRDVSRPVYLLSACSNNLNQYAKVPNTTGSVYAGDIGEMRRKVRRTLGRDARAAEPPCRDKMTVVFLQPDKLMSRRFSEVQLYCRRCERL